MSNIIVPVSGGKDSLLCLLMALEQGHNVKAVFNDTKWEHPITYRYLDYLRSKLGIEIHTTCGYITSKGEVAEGVEDLVRIVGRFPFGLGRFCTSKLKQEALKSYYRTKLHNGYTKYEIWYGMRSAESQQRSNKYSGFDREELYEMGELFSNLWPNFMASCLMAKLPIVDMSTEQVFKEIKNRGIEYNPLYDEGTNDRVGCYPCLLAGKKVQEAIFSTEVGKERLKIIKQLEIDIGQKYEMFDTGQDTCSLCKM